MKKLIQLSLLGAFATLQLVASDAKTETVKDNVKVEKVKVDMNQHFENLDVFKSMGVDFISNKQIGETGMYMLKGKQNNGSLIKIISDVTGQYMVIVDQRGQSQVVDVKNRKALSTPYDINLVKSKPEAFTYGTGSKHLYVFTDPECPACKEFEKKWESLKNDFTLHVYFYNLDFHKEANSMTKYIMSAKTNDEKAKRLIDIANGNTDYKTVKVSPEEEKNAASFIIDGKEIGDKIILEGTPTIIDENGENVNWPELLAKTPSLADTKEKK